MSFSFDFCSYIWQVEILLFPMNVEMIGRRVVIVGGGEVAERKARRFVESEAEVTVIAPKITAGIMELLAAKKLCVFERKYEAGDLAGAFAVIVATDDAAINAVVKKEAAEQGSLVNDAAGGESDFSVPAHFRRGKFLLTVSTGDISPAMSRAVRQKLEEEFPPAFGEWLEVLNGIRSEMKGQLKTPKERQSFWRAALDERVLDLVRAGDIAQAEVILRHAANNYGAKS